MVYVEIGKEAPKQKNVKSKKGLLERSIRLINRYSSRNFCFELRAFKTREIKIGARFKNVRVT